ncbi:hypothetical protein TPHA_0F00560 [Tetrapisispora phaffii CBS 4417]|uniref:Importin N-terminal domain-containing protein n=1 Tax=Tetrapisispora phaffii (strain ATCC 24235 / CBS 4417 / NBRC 1672 / NRRL Y-8282 / UCD 70-5) TaxID=1071381 RepID=G8BUW1_TETPH|nr:hypothetical protein TPHA_0F00560 [Tetrapisispora phaffii CBS 4417]CCE63543.1 hypothetical protein TPHA_0F00560 [Tetrapisispora phaffii CBS 4417]
MSSIEEIVHLVESLYAPQPSQDVNQIQQSLQVLQKSPQGLAFANELLKNDNYSPNVQYFGALTLTVQLNTNVNSFEKLWVLFKANLIHLTKYSKSYATNPQNKSMLLTTIKKLMSNLSLIFTNINENETTTAESTTITSWNNPLNTLLVLLTNSNNSKVEDWNLDDNVVDSMLVAAVNSQVSYQELSEFIQSSNELNNLLLTFTEIIVEDLVKYQSRKATMTNVYKILHDHLYITTMALININLNIPNNSNDTLYASISAWITCVSSFRNLSTHGNMDLSEMFQNLITVMCTSSEQTDKYHKAEQILAIFDNCFSNDPNLMSYDLRSQVEAIFLGVSKAGNADTSKNAWMLEYMNYLVTNEMVSELKELAICITDFLQISTLDVCNKLFTVIGTNSASPDNLNQYINVLLQMTNFPLTPILQEVFSVRMIDFWLDLADSFTNLAPETLSPQAQTLAADIFQQVVLIYLPKVSLINKEKILNEEGEDSSLHEFEDFKTATSDLIESLWNILGNDKLTNVLIDSISKTTSDSSKQQNVDLFQTEVMAFLLNTLLMDMNLAESHWICDIIGSNKNFINNILFLLESGFELPDSTLSYRHLKIEFIRTSSVLIGTLSGCFLQDASQLNQCVQTLFKGLESCIISASELNTKLENIVVKSIYTVFDTCRTELIPELSNSLTVLKSILRPDSNISNYSRERLMHTVGFIIQCVVANGPQEQANYICQLVDIISDLYERSLGIDMPNKSDYVHCLLSCISELGSALVQPDEMENSAILPRLQEFQQYWMEDPLHIRIKILALLNSALSNPDYGKDSHFIETSCLILGKTLTLPDSEPHFLRYNMSEMMEFMINQLPKTNYVNSLPFFSYLLERMVAHFKNNIGPQDIEFIFDRFFLSQYQQYIHNDPDLLQTLINFANSMLDSKPSQLMLCRYWNDFIVPEFLKLLPSREKFTISAVTKFWTKVINNRKYSQEELELSRQLIAHVGQELVYQTMFGLFHTQRSDLSNYTDLIRALVAKYPLQTKEWMIEALPKICEGKNAIHEKFINKLAITRGNRASGNAILEWWLQCNSLPTL